MKAVIVSTTADSEKALASIAETLVGERLAACCQVSGPIRSVYRWDGKVQSAMEYSCSVKTSATLASAVIESIRKLHPYDEPEIIATEIVGGSESYIGWIIDSVQSDSES